MQTINVGNIIRELRTERGMTQKQLADKMNISDKTVSKWERGLGWPDVSLLSELSDLFEVDIGKLLSGDLAPNDFVGENMKKTKYYVCPMCHNIWLHELISILHMLIILCKVLNNEADRLCLKWKLCNKSLNYYVSFYIKIKLER